MSLHKTTHKHATSEEFALNPIVASVATFLHLYLLCFHTRASYFISLSFCSFIISEKKK